MPEQLISDGPSPAVIDGLQKIADLSHEIVFMKDKAGRITFINETGVKFLGKSLAEIVGKDESELIDPSSAFESWESDHKVWTTAEAQQSKISWLVGDVTHHLWLTKYPIITAGEVTGIVVTGRPAAKETVDQGFAATLMGTGPLVRPINGAAAKPEQPANGGTSPGGETPPDPSKNLTALLLSLQAAMLSVASSLDQKHILDTMTWDLVHMLQVDFCIAFDWDEETNLLRPLSYYGEERNVQLRRPLNLNRYPFFVKSVQERRTLQLVTGQDSPQLREHRLLQKLGIQSLLILPLIFHDEVLGLIGLVSQKERHFSDWEISAVSLLASQCASSIVNARLYSQLDRANIALRASNEELDAFAHTVAHDLKGPLSNVVGFSDMLLQGDEKFAADNLHEYLRIIADNGKKMKGIISGLLLLSTVRQGEMESEELNMLLYVLEAKQRVAQQYHDHLIDIHIPEALPAAYGYGPWIEEVWTNYLSNAVKYGGRPAIIHVGAQAEPNHSRMIRFWVEDNGEGLSAEQQQKIFTPFTRLHQTKAEGHGLGLSIVRRIVEKLGGQVGVESILGKGSRFYFTLPGKL